MNLVNVLTNMTYFPYNTGCNTFADPEYIFYACQNPGTHTFISLTKSCHGFCTKVNHETRCSLS